MMKKNQSIGIFDSGIGGLTVAKAISALLPNESLIYFGDTEHMPYGDRSAEHIRGYSENIAEFLIAKGAKIIVIACNSASSVAYQMLKEKYQGKIDVVGVISPVVDYIISKDIKKVGIIGTKATIGSKNHEILLKDKKSNIKVASLATPLLAPMIEEGYFNNSISQTIINSYLSNWRFKGIQALVLACTHYPLLADKIRQYLPAGITVLSQGTIVAESLKNYLERHPEIEQQCTKAGSLSFYTTDDTDDFDRHATVFFGQKVHSTHVYQL